MTTIIVTLVDPHGETFVFDRDYFLSAKPVFVNGEYKYTLLRLKTKFSYRIKERPLEVKQLIDGNA